MSLIGQEILAASSRIKNLKKEIETLEAFVEQKKLRLQNPNEPDKTASLMMTGASRRRPKVYGDEVKKLKRTWNTTT